MDKNISWDLNGGHSLEEFWGDKRGGEKEWRENRGAMNKYVIHIDPQMVASRNINFIFLSLHVEGPFRWLMYCFVNKRISMIAACQQGCTGESLRNLSTADA